MTEKPSYQLMLQNSARPQDDALWLKLEKYCGPGSSGLILSLIKSLRSGLPLKHSDFSFLSLLGIELMDTLDKHCATEIHPAAKSLPLWPFPDYSHVGVDPAQCKHITMHCST